MILNVFKCMWECFCSCSSMIPCRGSRKLTLKRDVRDQAELNFRAVNIDDREKLLS